MNRSRAVRPATCALALMIFFGPVAWAAPSPEAGTTERIAVIHFHDHVSAAEIASFREAHRLDVAYRFQTIPALLVRTRGPRAEFAARHRAHAVVRLVDTDDFLAETGTLTSDPLCTEQSSHAPAGAIGGGTEPGLEFADIDSERARALSTGSSSVVVAIVDTGVDIAHPDLAANIFMNPDEVLDGMDNDGNGLIDDLHGWDFVGEDPDPSHPTSDTGFHGTRVAGVIGAVGDNGFGVAGVSWKVSMLPLRVGSDRSIIPSFAAAAIDYAVASGADIINNGWGSPSSSPSVQAAIAAASSAGVLVVNIAHPPATSSCGGRNHDAGPIYPAHYGYPLNLAVAGTNEAGELSAGSRFGPNTVHLAAPTRAIRTTSGLNDIAAYGCYAGASVAASTVSGAAALVLARFEALGKPLTGARLRDRLLDHAERRPELVPHVQLGRRLNVFRSMTTLDRSPPSAITDLAATARGNTVTLTWTAAGEDGAVGAAHATFVYRDDDPISISNFRHADRIDRLDGAPAAGGSPQSLVIEGLAYDTTYHFAVRSLDDWRNSSGLSNHVVVTTPSPPAIAFSPAALVVPVTTGETATGGFHVRNPGGSELTFDLADTARWLALSPRSGTVPPSDSVAIFYEIDASGARNTLLETLKVSSNDPGAWPGSSFLVVGNVTPAPEIAANPSPADFGDVPLLSVGTESVFVLNRGGEDLVVSSVSVAGAEFTLESTAGFTVASGEQRRVQVTFTATGAGSHAGSLTMASNDPFEPALVVPLFAVVSDTGAPARPEETLDLANSPNPFSDQTRFSFALPQAAEVRLHVYDIQGRLVRSIDAGVRAAGAQELTWDARDDSGRRIASGLYFYRMFRDGVPSDEIRRAVRLN